MPCAFSSKCLAGPCAESHAVSSCHALLALHCLSWRFQDAIQRPFEARDPGARARLITLLKHLAIRASKDDLIMLVKCHRKASQSLVHALPAAANPSRNCSAGHSASSTEVFPAGQSRERQMHKSKVAIGTTCRADNALISTSDHCRWCSWTLRRPTQPATTSLSRSSRTTCCWATGMWTKIDIPFGMDRGHPLTMSLCTGKPALLHKACSTTC